METKKRDEAPKKAKVKTPVVSEDESPAPKRTRKHDSSPSPSPDSIFKGGKKKGARYEKESKSRKEKSEADISSNGTVHWLQKNWKTALITALILGLFIWIKIKEDTFNRMNMNTTEQAQNVYISLSSRISMNC